MKKSLILVMAVLALLVVLPVSYAQDPNSAGAGQNFPVNKGKNLVWHETDTGTANFPAGHTIPVGAEREYFSLTGPYTTELQMDEIGAAPSKNTEITHISGCFVVEVPSHAKNNFLVKFNGGGSAVLVERPDSGFVIMGFCPGGGGTQVCSFGSVGGIQIFKEDDVIVSGVGGCVTIDPDGNVVPSPSGIGDAFLP